MVIISRGAAAISAGKGIWRREIPISGHFCGVR
jgi:hypothetical protein